MRNPARILVCHLLLAICYWPALAFQPAEIQPPSPQPSPSTPQPSSPPITIDREKKLIELDGIVPIDAHDNPTTKVYLEVIVCTPDSKEHETLVVTKAKASEVHAALLLIGLEPGTPGIWTWEKNKLASTPPTGPRLQVTIAYTDPDGKEVEAPASDWVITESASKTLTETAKEAGDTSGFVFAGSKFTKTKNGERYKADDDGTLVGLTTFGGETIAWHQVFSHQTDVQQPDWIANRALVPAYKTPVKVRISPAPLPADKPADKPAAEPNTPTESHPGAK